MLRAAEVRNATDGAGKPRDALALIVCQTFCRISAFVIVRSTRAGRTTLADATIGSVGSQLEMARGVSPRARHGVATGGPSARRRAKMRKPVCATMRCSGRTLRSRTCQKRRQRLERLDGREAAVRAQRVDELLHLQGGRYEGRDDAAGAKRLARARSRSRHGSARSTTMRSTSRSSRPSERVADAQRPVRCRRRGSARRCRGPWWRSPRAARTTRRGPVGPTARSRAMVSAPGPSPPRPRAPRGRCRPRGGSGRRPSGRSAAPGAGRLGMSWA